MNDPLNAFRQWFVSASGLPNLSVIPADDDGTRPSKPYATVKLISDAVSGGHDEVRQVESDPEQGAVLKAFSRVSGTVSVNVYGPGAGAYIRRAKGLLELANEASFPDGGTLVVRGAGSINDLTQLVDTTREERRQCDFDIAYAYTQEDGIDAGQIAQATVTGIFSGSGDNVTHIIEAGTPLEE